VRRSPEQREALADRAGAQRPISEVLGSNVDDFGVARAAARVGGRLRELLPQLLGFLGRQHDERLTQPDELGRHDTECT
jgi:hypothetical protein